MGLQQKNPLLLQYRYYKSLVHSLFQQKICFPCSLTRKYRFHFVQLRNFTHVYNLRLSFLTHRSLQKGDSANMTVVIYDSKSGRSANFIATMTFSKFPQLSHLNELIISSDLEVFGSFGILPNEPM